MRTNIDAIAALVALAILTLCSLAPAQPPANESAVELADEAFSKGRAFFEQGRLNEAAREFETSWWLDPSPGTLLNLGACRDGLGDPALALSTFERAAAEAKQARDPERRRLWLAAAQQRIRDLRRRVPSIVVRGVEPSSSITLDGNPIDSEAGDASAQALLLRVNPGRHLLRVSAVGKRSLTREFVIHEGARQTITLPLLEPSVGPTGAPGRLEIGAGAAEQTTPTSASSGGLGPWPLVLGATGAALLSGSVVTGWLATTKSNELGRACPDDDCPAAKALEETRDSGSRLARATDVLLITGSVFAGLGVTLYVLGSSDGADDDTGSGPNATAALRAGCFGEHCGLLASGRF